MTYYLLVMLSVVMFGGGFALTDVYRKLRGGSIASSLESSFIGSAAGLVVLLLASGSGFQATPFTVVMALIASVNGIAFAFCSFKALEKVNLSLYSLFSMLGGMVIPFFQGILFYGEQITIAKVVCFVLVSIALALTVSRDGKAKGGAIYYAGVFTLNGLAAALTKIFTDAPYAKTDGTWYSIWIAITTLVLSGTLWLLFFRKKSEKGFTWKVAGVSAASGLINRVANLLLVIALVHLDASLQYPMVTGGVIIVSTLICFFGKNKPSRKEIASVVIAFLGMLALFLIKI